MTANLSHDLGAGCDGRVGGVSGPAARYCAMIIRVSSDHTAPCSKSLGRRSRPRALLLTTSWCGGLHSYLLPCFRNLSRPCRGGGDTRNGFPTDSNCTPLLQLRRLRVTIARHGCGAINAGTTASSDCHGRPRSARDKPRAQPSIATFNPERLQRPIHQPHSRWSFAVGDRQPDLSRHRIQKTATDSVDADNRGLW